MKRQFAVAEPGGMTPLTNGISFAKADISVQLKSALQFCSLLTQSRRIVVHS